MQGLSAVGVFTKRSFLFTGIVATDSFDRITENSSVNHLEDSSYLLKVNNRNTRTRCEIYSNLTIKTPG